MIVYCVFLQFEGDRNELITICKDFITAETMAVRLNEQDKSVPQNLYYVEKREVF